MDIVVGSGPSGVAVAQALLAAGRSVTMLDAGLTLDAGRQARKQRLAARDPASWTAADLAFLQAPAALEGELPVKHSFGSDYPYAAPPGATPIDGHAMSAAPSYARGGLSTVWGSALLPFRDGDTRDWPITPEDLREGYRAASTLLPVSAVRDDLEAAFPLYAPPVGALLPSRQAERLLATLGRNRERLRAEGVTFGRARLAVDAPHCVRCGLCLHGCSYDLIYSASSTLARQRAIGMTYVPNLLVRSVVETSRGVEVRAIRSDGTGVSFAGFRIFLAAGVINTTEIMLRSMGWYDRPVHIKDAQYVIIPTFTRHCMPHVETERLHTLCQAFIEIEDRALSPFTINMQAYTYNDILRDLLLAKAGPLRGFVPRGVILGRLGVLQSYLHSDHSGTIEATLTRSSQGDRLSLVGRTQPATVRIVAGVLEKLRRLARLTGWRPVPAMVEITEPGRGFHTGGTFPMAREPTDGNADLLGRPYGYSRVHLVDSSTFPSIPATTITLAVMANAHRIGAAVAAAALA